MGNSSARLAMPARVGMVGCGNISARYLQNAALFADRFVISCCTDLQPERARSVANRAGVPACATLDEMLARPDVDVILNLTNPPAHTEVSLAALTAGKHLYSEKPLAITVAEAGEILRLAEEKGLAVGCAPDTFLGASGQEARALVDAGVIGPVIAGCAFMLTGGPESWHPDPESFYQPGSGPLWDMGPYYISALVNLLGPVRQVCAAARQGSEVRRIGSGPRQGQTFPVATPSHVAGVLIFHSGAVVTLVTSFDVACSSVPFLELYGAGGALQLPDPNTFSGTIRLKRCDARWWKKIRHGGRPWKKESRGLGLADLAQSIASGAMPRCSGQLAFHGAEVMGALLTSAQSGRAVDVSSQPERPSPL